MPGLARSQGASKTNISMLCDDSQGSEAVKAIHNEFFPHPQSKITPEVNL